MPDIPGPGPAGPASPLPARPDEPEWIMGGESGSFRDDSASEAAACGAIALTGPSGTLRISATLGGPGTLRFGHHLP